jgi:hypothetical protein
MKTRLQTLLLIQKCTFALLRLGDMVDAKSLEVWQQKIKAHEPMRSPIHEGILGKHPDLREPKWEKMKQMSTADMIAAVNSGELLTVGLCRLNQVDP